MSYTLNPLAIAVEGIMLKHPLTIASDGFIAFTSGYITIPGRQPGEYLLIEIPSVPVETLEIRVPIRVIEITPELVRTSAVMPQFAEITIPSIPKKGLGAATVKKSSSAAPSVRKDVNINNQDSKVDYLPEN
jgi:hypothetical protein